MVNQAERHRSQGGMVRLCLGVNTRGCSPEAVLARRLARVQLNHRAKPWV
jgi:hypothetical protein